MYNTKENQQVVYVCTHMHIDVTMRVKEETLNLRAVGTQQELKERMGRNDVNTVHMQEILRPMPEKKGLFKDDSWLHQVYSQN